MGKHKKKKTSQSTIIKEALCIYMESGTTDKKKLYDKVENEFGFPRATIRRAAGEHLANLREQVKILSDDK